MFRGRFFPDMVYKQMYQNNQSNSKQLHMQNNFSLAITQNFSQMKIEMSVDCMANEQCYIIYYVCIRNTTYLVLFVAVITSQGNISRKLKNVIIQEHKLI